MALKPQIYYRMQIPAVAGNETMREIPRRYTIEFCLNTKGLYYIEQIQGRYNREQTTKMKSYVQEIINSAKN